MSGAPSAIDSATRRAYRESDYRVHAEPPLTLRIDVRSEALERLHEAYRVRGSAFLTACNPLGRRLAPHRNDARQARLAAELERDGIPFLPGIGEHPKGGWPGEPSVLAFGPDPELACTLGRRHAQNAIVVCGADAIPRLVLLR